MDITKELISLIMGIVFLLAVTAFLMSMHYDAPPKELGSEKYQAAEDIGRLVSKCCLRHSGSYRTYNDDCELLDFSITEGEVTMDMISWYVDEGCIFDLGNPISGEGKIKITYLGREKKIRITVIQ